MELNTPNYLTFFGVSVSCLRDPFVPNRNFDKNLELIISQILCQKALRDNGEQVDQLAYGRVTCITAVSV